MPFMPLKIKDGKWDKSFRCDCVLHVGKPGRREWEWETERC